MRIEQPRVRPPFLWNYEDCRAIIWRFPIHGGTPSYHPFIDVFHEINKRNHPLVGGAIIMLKNHGVRQWVSDDIL